LNIDARKEKLVIPPIVKLHRYATRKPLITSRMVVVAGILGENDLRDDEDFNTLIGIDAKLKTRGYKYLPQPLVKKIDKKYPEKPTILDPFAGTGTIPFEALRLGLNVVALDYNPVAYLIMKGTLEYPLKYGKTIYKDVEEYSKKIYDKLKEELSCYYPKHHGVEPRSYIHCWAVKCPTCGNITPLVNNWVLDGKRKIGLKYEVKNNHVDYSITHNEQVQEGNVYRGKGTCIFCSSEIPNDYIVKDISENEREILLAVYLYNREFELPIPEDIEAIENARKHLKENLNEFGKYIPTESMMDEVRSKKYLKYWYKLFNPRQLLVSVKLAKLIHETMQELAKEDREYAAAVGIYLSMIHSKMIRKNSRSSMWNSGDVKIQGA